MKITIRNGSAIIWQGADWPGLSFFSVCSGIEAASVAWKLLGWRPAGFAEIEKFPSAVLAHHYPRVRNHGDFTALIDRAATLPRVDILCGGTPCQAFSVAGARRSLDDARGNLTLAFVELAHAMQPRNVVWENVPGVLSTKDNAFGCFLAGLVGADSALPPPNGKRWPNAGMVTGPKGRAAWRVLDAQYFGLAQRRKRVIVIADFGNGADPAAVLFEPEGVRRDSPPSRETGQGITGTIAARTRGGGGLGTDFDLDGGLVPSVDVVCMANGQGGKQQTFLAQTVALRGRDGGATAELGDDVAFALRAGGGGGDKPHVLAPISFDCKASGQSGFGVGDIASTLRAMGHADSHQNGGGHLAVVLSSAARRLTPRECERLQGFQFRVHASYPGAWQDHAGQWWSPDYTVIPWRGKPAADCPDGPRYKALGNSWAVPKFTWLGRRIARLMPR